MKCLDLIDTTDSVVIPIADKCSNEDVSCNNYSTDTTLIDDEIELNVAATIEDTADVDVTPTVDTDITNVVDDIDTPIADDATIVSTDPPTPRRRGKVRYNI